MSAWRVAEPSLLVREDSAAKASASARIAGFDLNDTLVSSKSGAPGYHLTLADWQYYSSTVASKLRELHGQGFKLVIFTNQGNIKSALQGKRAQAVRAYVDDMLRDLGVPVQVFTSTQQDRFRKPAVGMWEYLEQRCNNGVEVKRSESFYVGDASGGPGEHSAADSEFAKALNVKFYHARDFFGPPHGTPASSSSNTAIVGTKRPLLEQTSERPPKVAAACGLSSSEEIGNPAWQVVVSSGKIVPPIVLVLVGAPGSGKSTFAERLGPPAPAGPRAKAKASGGGLAGREAAPWRRVCQDLLGNKDACLRAASSCLKQGLSVVIDRTNVDRDQRAPWLDLAKANGAECHCLVFDVSMDECCRRVAGRQTHEGGLAGGGSSRVVVMKLFAQLRPVTGSESCSRVRVVRTFEDVDRETRCYGGELRQSATCTFSSIGATSAQIGSGREQASIPPEAQMRDTTSVEGTDRTQPRSTPVGAAQSKQSEQSKVEMLIALGFERAQCQLVLASAGGDVNVAANRLLAERLVG
eukprot:TRINITY_DN15994_c0_g1_i1.p1 TRINITY_DN15994_c0_g1~~TRINITY_DN15994_c0_g1_i1.p1  ORF type:complete len:525 (+),score=59.03 TRINITY_DN15994_c0_g1_i1:65-1639(+)